MKLKFGQSVKLPNDDQSIQTESLSHDIQPIYKPDQYEIWVIQNRMKKLGFNITTAEAERIILQHRK
jgi:hypothetical protein